MGLFGNKKEESVVVAEPKAPVSTSNKTVIGEGVTFVGDFVSDEEFVIKGSVKGTITSSTHVCVDKTGSHYGKLGAKNVTIKGYAESDIICHDTTHISETGKMKGHLVTANLETDHGSVFDGTVKLNKAGAPVVNPVDVEVAKTEELFK